jgi:hypothetical protein
MHPMMVKIKRIRCHLLQNKGIMTDMITRRKCVQLGMSSLGTLLLHSKRGLAFGAESQVGVAEIILDGISISRPLAWERALVATSSTTSIDVNPVSSKVTLTNNDIYLHPFSVLILQNPLPQLPKESLQRLQRYLSYGGFLLIDDTSGRKEGPIHDSVVRLCRQLFPTKPLAPLRADHSLYRAFFLFQDPPHGRVAIKDYNEGVEVGEISPLIYIPNDLSGALDRDGSGRDLHPCIPGGEYQRTEALKLAINLFMYSLTSNYKHDQAHVKKLLEEGRL